MIPAFRYDPKGPRLIHSIAIGGMLSFDRMDDPLPLEPLNVLIGPNASGKSNFLDVLELLSGFCDDLGKFLRERGGTDAWPHLTTGASEAGGFRTMTLDTVVHTRFGPLRHMIRLRIWRHFADVDFESVALLDGSPSPIWRPVYMNSENGQWVLARTREDFDLARRDQIRLENLLPSRSILSQLQDWRQYPEITELRALFSSIMSFGQWIVGRKSPARMPQLADLPNDFLLPSGENLALVLNDLELRGLKPSIIEKMREIAEEFQDFTVRVQGGTVQLFVREESSALVSSLRISDGTIRYLCLLAILCHPAPPPLICIEEPELGLHPDLLSGIADLLIEASSRTQLVVATHSGTILDGLSENPSAVVVCEKWDGATHLERLDPVELTPFLEDESLGKLWSQGHLGGTRW